MRAPRRRWLPRSGTARGGVVVPRVFGGTPARRHPPTRPRIASIFYMLYMYIYMYLSFYIYTPSAYVRSSNMPARYLFEWTNIVSVYSSEPVEPVQRKKRVASTIPEIETKSNSSRLRFTVDLSRDTRTPRENPLPQPPRQILSDFFLPRRRCRRRFVRNTPTTPVPRSPAPEKPALFSFVRFRVARFSRDRTFLGLSVYRGARARAGRRSPFSERVDPAVVPDRIVSPHESRRDADRRVETSVRDRFRIDFGSSSATILSPSGAKSFPTNGKRIKDRFTGIPWITDARDSATWDRPKRRRGSRPSVATKISFSRPWTIRSERGSSRVLAKRSNRKRFGGSATFGRDTARNKKSRDERSVARGNGARRSWPRYRWVDGIVEKGRRAGTGIGVGIGER
ncbi:poly(rC)-binding protein mub isoform X5 [Megalopta genalis]|uniref:poly(rC)-binding protein mub isoform X5 n=1 Tax=Megalopta genalis TaxID=115081 RepID=UPI003FD516B3